MINQLSQVTEQQFEFFFKAGYTMDNIANFIMESYEQILLEPEEYDSNPRTEFLPAQFHILSHCLYDFESLKYEHALNGHDPDFLEEVQNHDDGEEGVNDFFVSLSMTRYHTAGYPRLAYDDDEIKFQDEILHAMNFFHFSYFADNSGKYTANPPNYQVGKMVNAPLLGVW